MTEAEDKVEADEKEKIEAAITALEEVVKGDDLAEIEAKTKDLTDASTGLPNACMLRRRHRKALPDREDAAEAQAGGAAEDAVDAEFEEVKEDEK